MITQWYRRHGKRLFDIFLASGGLLFFSLLMGWVAVRIRQELGSPVLFRQERVGRGGVAFTILKFRTMSDDKTVPSSFCRWLRATAFDELPQLLNIAKGEMSFVGPRPLIPEELAELSGIPGGDLRLSIRPGLAGLAQLYGAKNPSLPKRLRWDLLYVNRSSFLLDLQILFKSLRMTTRGSWDKPGPQDG